MHNFHKSWNPPPQRKKLEMNVGKKLNLEKINGCNEDCKQWIHLVVEPKEIEISIAKSWICRFHVMKDK